jgi:hypothetical protein
LAHHREDSSSQQRRWRRRPSQSPSSSPSSSSSSSSPTTALEYEEERRSVLRHTCEWAMLPDGPSAAVAAAVDEGGTLAVSYLELDRARADAKARVVQQYLLRARSGSSSSTAGTTTTTTTAAAAAATTTSRDWSGQSLWALQSDDVLQDEANDEQVEEDEDSLLDFDRWEPERAPRAAVSAAQAGTATAADSVEMTAPHANDDDGSREDDDIDEEEDDEAAALRIAMEMSMLGEHDDANAVTAADTVDDEVTAATAAAGLAAKAAEAPAPSQALSQQQQQRRVQEPRRRVLPPLCVVLADLLLSPTTLGVALQKPEKAAEFLCLALELTGTAAVPVDLGTTGGRGGGGGGGGTVGAGGGRKEGVADAAATVTPPTANTADLVTLQACCRTVARTNGFMGCLLELLTQDKLVSDTKQATDDYLSLVATRAAGAGLPPGGVSRGAQGVVATGKASGVSGASLRFAPGHPAQNPLAHMLKQVHAGDEEESSRRGGKEQPRRRNGGGRKQEHQEGGDDPCWTGTVGGGRD